MKQIKIKEKTFSLYIGSDQIANAVKNIANSIHLSMSGKCPLFVPVLNGSFIFAADLLRQLNIPCELFFMKLSSYEGVRSSGNINVSIDLDNRVKGRTVVFIEDIVDTGNTVKYLYDRAMFLGASEIVFVTLLFKPEMYRQNIKISYIGMEIANDFIIGYGLDYDGLGRNLPDIYKLE